METEQLLSRPVAVSSMPDRDAEAAARRQRMQETEARLRARRPSAEDWIARVNRL